MISPLDLIGAHPWRRVIFTTYSLSLSFFEALVLDRLVRGGGRGALILSDVDGVRGALGEQGARRAGREYDVEPVSVLTGVFHPKLSVLVGDGECHLLVGSGNLTFGGWGGNFELFEHLHAGFAVDAIRDASEFFELLAESPNVRHGAPAQCLEIARNLSQSVQGRQGDGKVRFLHTFRRSILAQMTGLAEDLGGATRLIVGSPYWDKGAALDNLCRNIKLDVAHVHSHGGGVVRGSFGSNWPRNSKTSVEPICLNVLNIDSAKRPLHAKVFEILCRRGRIIISGSANATTAALGEGGNIEACVARIEREPSVGWSYVPAEPPEEPTDSEAETDEIAGRGVLRATLEGDTLYGEVLDPQMNGAAKALLLTPEGAQHLGSVTLDRNSRFSMHITGLELRFLQGNRFTLQIEGNDGTRAEGFISLVAFSEISRRSGTLAPRLFALLTANETPADVAAIMSWICEDPTVLAKDHFVAGGEPEADTPLDDERTIAVSELQGSAAVLPSLQSNLGVGRNATWKRFIEAFLASLRQHRGPFQGQMANPIRDDEDDDEDVKKEPEPKDPWIDRSLSVFRRVFELLLSSENARRYFTVAFDLTQYICERLEPEKGDISEWLRSLIHARAKYDIKLEQTGTIAAAILVLYSDEEPIEGARGARLQLLRLGFACDGDPPDMAAVEGFRAALAPSIDFGERWKVIKNVRTMPEQVQAYLKAVLSSAPSSEYPDLQKQSEEWPTLEGAISDPDNRDDFRTVSLGTSACPRCSRDLPQQEIYKLRSQSVAMARNCCGRVLICAEM